ncbi:MAG TPA: hypothetical protein VFQ61_37825 [Polyangiaceae bacterium]|nr:hypothetical protein [Polyangiaceae bacterium]
MSRHRGSEGSAGLAALGAELENALIPLNRSAARRALCRLARETTRALGAGLNTVQPAPPASKASSSESRVSAPLPGPIPAPVQPVAPDGALDAPLNPGDSAVNEKGRGVERDSARRGVQIALVRRSPTESSPQTPRLGTRIDATADELSDDITQRMPNVQTVPAARASFTETRVPSRHLDTSDNAHPLERGTRPPGEQTPFWGVPAVHLSPREAGANKAPKPSATPSVGAKNKPQFTPGPDALAASYAPPLSPEEEDELEIEILPEPLELSPCRVPPVEPMSHECSAEPSPDSLDVTPVAHHKLVEALHACTTYAGQGAQRSDVRELIADFQVHADWTEDELSRELKGLAQVELTPAGANAGPRAKSSRR